MMLSWLAVAAVTAAPSSGWTAAAPAAGDRSGASTPEQFDLATTAARLDALHVRIHGHRTELQASELLSYHQIEGGVKACMRAAGKAYRPAPFVSHYDEFTDADLGFGSGSGSVFDSVTDRGRRMILNERAAARSARAGLLTWWDKMPPADVPAHNRCTAPYQHRTYPDFEPPAGVYLFPALGELFGPVVRDPAVIAAMRPYRSCMKRRFGYDVTERTDFLFAPRISYRDAPVAGRPVPAAWSRGLRQIRVVFAADIACRLPAHRIAMRLLAPRIGPWQRKHHAELAAVRAAWQERVILARPLKKTL
jgi:hypothetical protein